ncbi:MAG: translation initiation factor IF-5A [Candidatus Aenigmarchaeota archaeon]|nr:translation initiation factor IF-5A [Candidatus Aenigmarchaeota archaeon]
MDKTISSIKDLKPGSFVVFDDEPCRVTAIDVHKSGKHGAAKARVEAAGIFDGKNRSVVKPADDSVDVPIMTKRKAQVISIQSNKAQIMDLEDFQVYELDIPEERKDKVNQGEEIYYFEVWGRKTLKELK